MSVGYRYAKWIEFLAHEYSWGLKLGGDIEVSDEIELAILQAIMKANTIAGEQDPSALTNALMELGGKFKIAAAFWQRQGNTNARKTAQHATICYSLAEEFAKLAGLDWVLSELQTNQIETLELTIKAMPSPVHDFPIP